MKKTYCDFCLKELSVSDAAYPRQVLLTGLAGTLYTTSSMELRGTPGPESSLTMDSCYDCLQHVLTTSMALQHRSQA